MVCLAQATHSTQSHNRFNSVLVIVFVLDRFSIYFTLGAHNTFPIVLGNFIRMHKMFIM